MLNKKLFVPAILIVSGVLAGGVMIASAQDTTMTADMTAGAGDTAPIVQISERGGGRDGHFGRGDRGGKGFGRRGGSELFQNLFTQVDADKNGTVSQAEIDSFRTAQIASADVSKDSALSIEEFESLYRNFIRPQMVDAFQNFDADGDGKITTAELDARLGNVIARLDRNGDGALGLNDRGGRNGNN